MLNRHFFVWLHRWAGLTMACFLVVVGLTGSLLAFRNEIDRLASPRFFAKPQPGVAQLDLATLTDRAEALVPQGQAYWIVAAPDEVTVAFIPRKNPATGKPYRLDLDWLYLNPWTGQELGRVKPGESGPSWLTVPILNLHATLFLGGAGFWMLGVVALVWTLDCFVGFYLTLPASIGRFWQRWKQAWQVKWRASAFRVNFDLHRASGLWLWPALFVLALSSVMFNLPAVYHRLTDAILDYRPPPADGMSMSPTGEDLPPLIDFRAGLSTAQHLMAEQAASHGFSVERPVVFQYEYDHHAYFYNVKSSRDVWDRDHTSMTTLTFNADTGDLRSLNLPTGEHTGNTVFTWLVGLHQAWVFGLPYRIFLCVLGIVIAMLSYTGVYIWWRKRQGRILAARKKQASFTKDVLQMEGGSR